MRGPVILLAVGLLLAACTTNPVPEGYKGPLAHIADSEVACGKTGADFFFLSEVNGKRIDDSLAATSMANSGRGFAMTPVTLGREVPAQPSTFTIIGRTHYAAPIIALFRRVYEVSGETRFTPLPDHSYVVKGVLGENYSAVWIEDRKTGELVGQKVEVKGSSSLGILEK
jgi:hypothetical protein